MEDRIGRDMKRHHLGMRMIAHQARTQTICDFTGLARERTKTLRREWHVTSKDRRRGPAPTSLASFFADSRIRSEASCIAAFCRILGAVPAERMVDAERQFPTLERGERLCDVFEAYRTFFPDSEISFDHVVLLAVGLASGEIAELTVCKDCPAAILIDRLAVGARLCELCEDAAKSVAPMLEHGELKEEPSPLGSPSELAAVQIAIFTTGGAIDKTYSGAIGYQVGAPMVRQLLSHARVGVAVATVIELLRRDGLELTDDDRAAIRNAVANCEHARVIVTHCTDTVLETARALKDIPNKTVVLTGSVQPARFIDSDAHFNLGMAVAAAQTLPPGVYIAANGRISPVLA